jgi:hypothetical protein
MGFFRQLFGTWESSGDDYLDAVRAWNRYARASLLRYSSALQGQRVTIEYQGNFAGAEEAALIVRVGLDDLGARVVRATM